MLLFACHADTVPVGDGAQWARDPLGGDLVRGRITGRGASDMKGGLAAAVTALKTAAAGNVSCGLLLTADEEIGCLGARAAVQALKAESIGAVIIPESTGNDVRLGHRGALWLRLTARGRAAHGSTPELGRNALLDLAAALTDLDARLPRRHREELGTTTVNIATMTAGTSVNIVPDRAEATVDVRYVDGDEPTAIGGWLAAEHPRIGVSVLRRLRPVLSPSDDPWIRALPAELSACPAPYFTDAAELVAVLARRPVVIWGPGQPELAHAVDESVGVEDVQRAAGMYGRVLTAWPGPVPG
jgi:succinyl-diaminopimelate desuccinylase